MAKPQALLREDATGATPENPVPANESERLAAVRRYDILDTPPDGACDRITAIAARLFNVPISIISVVDRDRIWFKSRHGVSATEIGRDPGLCASVVLRNEPRILPDAKIDPHALANPLVAGEFGLRFYAGVPLRTRDGFNLGTLCVIDKEPREISAEEIALLEDLASVVMDQLELRLAARKAIEAAARETADRLLGVLPAAVYATDAEGRITFYNEAAANLWGRRPEVGKSERPGSWSLYWPDGTPMPHDESPMAIALKERRPILGHAAAERPDGIRVPFFAYSVPQFDESGVLAGVVNTLVDLTQRKQSQEVAQRFRFMAETMPQKIFTATASGDVDYFNQQWTDFTGLTFAQIRGWGWTQFIHPDDVEENIQRWRHSIKTGEPLEITHRFRRADGAYRWHLSRARAMRDAAGNISMWIGSNTEVHEQKEMAETLRESEERLSAELTATRLLQRISAELVHEQDLQSLYAKLVDAAAGILRSDCASMQVCIQNAAPRASSASWRPVDSARRPPSPGNGCMRTHIVPAVWPCAPGSE
ncbi:MAG: PAS domain S-box protein [Methylocella sp.]